MEDRRKESRTTVCSGLPFCESAEEIFSSLRRRFIGHTRPAWQLVVC